MALHRMVPSLAVLILVVLIGSIIAVQNVAIAEEYRGTMAQQMACTPDVFRLCGSQIPDVNRIVGCLRQNTAQLSGPCRAVFESNASVPPPSQPTVPGRREYPAENDDQ
jgi:hypothetical protein